MGIADREAWPSSRDSTLRSACCLGVRACSPSNPTTTVGAFCNNGIKGENMLVMWYMHTYIIISSSVFIGHSPVDRSYKSCLKILTHHSSNLLMRGKLSVKHYVRPAHVKAGFK